jgi:hypothetical protein
MSVANRQKRALYKPHQNKLVISTTNRYIIPEKRQAINLTHAEKRREKINIYASSQ